MKKYFMLFTLISLTYVIHAENNNKFTVHQDKDYNIRDFDYKFFGLVSSYPQGYYKINTGLHEGERVISYIDENNDKFTDIITYKQIENITSFYLNHYNSTSGTFTKVNVPLFQINIPNIEITNVFGGTLTPNDTLSFIVSYYDKSNSSHNSVIYHKDKGTTTTYKAISSFTNTSIIIGDIDGDRNLDIIYHDGEVRMVRHFTSNLNEVNTDFTAYLYDDSTLCGNNNMYVNTKFGMLGTAIIDVDGDCQNDLLITTVDDDGNYILQIYRGRVIKEQGKRLYCLGSNSILQLNKDYGSFTLGDFNNDGYVDLIFPYKSQCNVDIYFNINVMKYDWTKNYCDEHKPKDHLPIVFSNSNVTTYALQSNNDMNCSFIYNSDISSTSTAILRVGDFKSEALPGLIVTQFINNATKVVRLYGNDYQGFHNDQHVISWDINAEFTSCIHPLYASFFDFNENGQLDFIIVCDDDNQSVHAYFNHYHPDKYFIKSEMLLHENKFYSNEIGTSYRYIATNNDGSRRMDYTWQLSQNNDMIMNVPYALVGIGRSNNYIENFCVISNSVDYPLSKKNSADDDYHIFTPIIPKSQLLITKALTNKNEIKWNIDLIVNPTDNMLVLMIVVAVILLIILIVIIILHVKEFREDKKQSGDKFSQWFA